MLNLLIFYLFGCIYAAYMVGMVRGFTLRDNDKLGEKWYYVPFFIGMSWVFPAAHQVRSFIRWVRHG